MTAWLLSFVPTWAWIVVGLGGAALARVYVGPRAALAILAAVALWAAYLGGVAHERGRGEVARLEAELAIAKDDIAKTKRAEADATPRAARVDQADKTNQEIVDAIDRTYPPAEPDPEPLSPAAVDPGDRSPPVTRQAPARPCRCTLTDADVQFLRRIK